MGSSRINHRRSSMDFPVANAIHSSFYNELSLRHWWNRMILRQSALFPSIFILKITECRRFQSSWSDEIARRWHHKRQVFRFQRKKSNRKYFCSLLALVSLTLLFPFVAFDVTISPILLTFPFSTCFSPVERIVIVVDGQHIVFCASKHFNWFLFLLFPTRNVFSSFSASALGSRAHQLNSPSPKKTSHTQQQEVNRRRETYERRTQLLLNCARKSSSYFALPTLIRFQLNSTIFHLNFFSSQFISLPAAVLPRSHFRPLSGDTTMTSIRRSEEIKCIW